MVKFVAATDDRWPQKHEKCSAGPAFGLILEQIADKRNVAQHRHLAFSRNPVVRYQSTQHDHAAIVRKHGRLDAAPVCNEVRRAGDYGINKG